MNMTLDEFIQSDWRNLYITFVSSKGVKITSYVRKSYRVINGKIYENVLDRANTSIKTARFTKKILSSGMANSGAYREFDTHMTELAKKYGFDGIYVENVLNKVLVAVLPRYGYELAKIDDAGTPSFWKPLKD